MRFYIWSIVVLTAISILVAGLNVYVLGITLNSYDHVSREIPAFPEELNFTLNSELTEEQQEWIDTYAPLIDPETAP